MTIYIMIRIRVRLLSLHRLELLDLQTWLGDRVKTSHVLMVTCWQGGNWNNALGADGGKQLVNPNEHSLESNLRPIPQQWSNHSKIGLYATTVPTISSE